MNYIAEVSSGYLRIVEKRQGCKIMDYDWIGSTFLLFKQKNNGFYQSEAKKEKTRRARLPHSLLNCSLCLARLPACLLVCTLRSLFHSSSFSTSLNIFIFHTIPLFFVVLPQTISFSSIFFSLVEMHYNKRSQILMILDIFRKERVKGQRYKDMKKY